MIALLSLTQFTSFLTILAVGFVYILATSALGAIGGGHDADHHDGDSSHDHETISVFSPKIIAIFMVGFGSAGCLATHYGLGAILATVAGLGGGLVLGSAALIGLRLLYSQQASSEIHISDAVGLTGTVTLAIPTVGRGEVGVSVKGQYLVYPAFSRGVAFAINSNVRIQAAEGSLLIVG